MIPSRITSVERLESRVEKKVQFHKVFLRSDESEWSPIRSNHSKFQCLSNLLRYPYLASAFSAALSELTIYRPTAPYS
jgi:hypothetical protein